MSSQNSKSFLRRIPLWAIVLLTAFSIILLSSASIMRYQQSQSDPVTSAKNSQLESLKQQILQQADVIDVNWLRTLNPLMKNVQGRLVWSSTLQQGIMEYNKLPGLSDKQQYRLWIYDLVGDITKPIKAIEFKHPKSITNHFLMSFTSTLKIIAPLKFELTLEEEGSENGVPLLLAQP